jgi:UDP-N-acetylglucosamine 2-epimerase (non-hydrolysing)
VTPVVPSLLHVVGARPNFAKLAAVHRAAAGSLDQTIVHTGQHYDAAMSALFFDQLGVPAPEIDLEVGSATHAVQTATVMMRLEPVLVERRPDWVLVYGDVNSTLAATLVACKLGVPVAHVEAGLRSRDRTMPEEINRLVTDSLADLLFTPSADADANLAAEGIPAARVHRVGNVMIDTLLRLLPATEPDAVLARLGLVRPFALVTLHRPSSVDDPAILAPLVAALGELGDTVEVVFPVHPRTRAALGRFDVSPPAALRLLEPLGYLEFLALERRAALVVTDSGGVQEETSFLGVPCLTVRDNTERPITLELGTNVLVGRDPARLLDAARRALAAPRRDAPRIPLWDGRAGERIVDVLTARAT